MFCIPLESSSLVCNHCGSDFIEEIEDIQGVDEEVRLEQSFENPATMIMMEMMMQLTQRDHIEQNRRQQRENTRPTSQSDTHSRQQRRSVPNNLSSNQEITVSDETPDGDSENVDTRPILFARSIRRRNPSRNARRGQWEDDTEGAFEETDNENPGGDDDIRDRMVQDLFRHFSQLFRSQDGENEASAGTRAFFIHPFGSTGASNLGDYIISQQNLDELLTQLMERHAQENLPPAADKETIDNLAKIPFKDSEQDHKDCPVCQENYTEGIELLKLPCKHTFHPNCITSWLKINGSCPVCRFSLVKKDENNNNEGAAGSERFSASNED